jgi:hypothetical protein
MNMQRLFLFTIFLLAFCTVHAQKAECDSIIFQKQYFKGTKRLSAYCYRLKSTETGKARAWNREGKLIFECEVSLRHGVHSADFYFYPDGAIERVEEHQAPDAGIQWYETTHFFDQAGNKLREEHRDWDETTTLKWTLETEQQVVVPPKQQEVVKEDPLHAYSISLKNETPFTLEVTATWGIQTQTTLILSGARVEVLTYTNISECLSPDEHLQWSVEATGRGKRKAKKVSWKIGPASEGGKVADKCAFEYRVVGVIK